MRVCWAMFATLSLALNPAPASGDEQMAKFDIEKMTCAACPIAVRKAMERVNGVKEVLVDLQSKTAVVTFDASLTSVSEIGNASTAVGFPATVQDDK